MMFYSTHRINGTQFTKTYSRLDDFHWNRIYNAALLLSDNNIGPRVLDIDHEHHEISYEIISFLGDDGEIPRDLFLTKEQMINQITTLIDKLHDLGYFHGDMCIGNIGYKNNTMYLIDPDTIHPITDQPDAWMNEWITKYFDWEGSFSEFIEYDYTNWLEMLC